MGFVYRFGYRLNNRNRLMKRTNVNLNAEDIERLIDLWVLHERNRKIAKRRLLDGIGIENLGEEFNLTPRQIQNIIYKVQDIIFSHIA